MSSRDAAYEPDIAMLRREVIAALESQPHSSGELVVSPDFLRAMQADGLIELDPDRFPDRYVPGNPLIARLPNDERPWPGWDRWNV